MFKIEDKRQTVLELVSLGMELEKAFLLAECTDADQDKLEKDPSFEKELSLYMAKEELRLLKQHRKACAVAARRGSPGGLQWKLGKVNPDKWGDKKDSGPIRGTLILTKEDEDLV